jgi:hypothetical protein
MKISELLKEAQYSRITIGDRWLIWTSKGWEVLERKRKQKNTRFVVTTQSEDEAVLELLKGESDLYSDVIKKAKKQ